MAAYKDEKHNTWYVKFRYTDWQGKSKSTSKRGFKTKREALQYEADAKLEAKEPARITLAKLSEEFLKDYKAKNRLSSYMCAEKNCRKYILPSLGSIIISKITPLMISKWQSSLLQYDLKESTIRNINSTLTILLNYGVKFYGLKSNPIHVVGKQGKVTRRLEFIEADDWSKIDAEIDNLFDKVTLNLLYYTGMRMGELLGLTREDIDLDNATISINKQYTRQKTITAPKTSSSVRVISIPAFLVSLIKKYLEASAYVESEHIFAIYSWPKIGRSLAKYCKKAKLPPVHPHALRHSHASFLIRQGIPINAIAKRLGHSSPSITLNIYSHCYHTQDSDIADMLDKNHEEESKNKNVGQM